MCRSSDLTLTNIAAVEEGGTMPRMMHSHLVHVQQGFQQAGYVACSVSQDGDRCPQGLCEISTVPRSSKTTRQRIRCPLRILLTACLGILCTFVTYLSLPDNCIDDASSVSSQGRYRRATRLIHSNIHAQKRNSDPLNEGGDWEHSNEKFSNDRLSKYCNFAPGGMSGDEGKGISEKYDLLQVRLLLSPGQRSLSSSSPGLPDARHSCRLDNKANSFQEVWNFMQEAISYKRNQHYKGAFKTYEVYPWGATCSPGQLLPDGIHQLILLGNFLKKAYRQKLEEVSSKGSHSVRIHVVSHPEEVKYQTALSVSQGFLEPSEFQKIVIHKSTDNFCSSQNNQTCRCLHTESLKQFVDRAVKRGHYMFKPGHTSTKHLTERINQQNVELGSVLELSESLLLRACQGKYLFCNEGTNCLDNPLIDLLIRESNSHWQNLTKDSIFRSYSKLHAYPFLRGIAEFESHAEAGIGSNLFLYSGGPEFITHVLSALEFKMIEAPPYASHLAIEIFERKTRLGQKKHFIRLLHDGKDITGSLPFCQDKLVDGLCKLKFFKHHLNSEVLSYKMSYEEACTS